MRQGKVILDLAKQNNGMITSAIVVKNGLARGSLKHLVNTGQLEQVNRGVYCLPDAWEDEFFSLQARYKKGIFSLDTALFLHDLTDRNPDKFFMTFPSGYNFSKIKDERIIARSIQSSLHLLGVEGKTTTSGNFVRVYNPERCLCDIVKTRNKCDIQLISEVFKNYVRSENKDIHRLSEYSKLLKVEKIIRSYLEVLLWQI